MYYLNTTSSRPFITNAENTDLMSEAHSQGEIRTVSRELDYGMDLANFILGKHSLNLLHVGCEAKAACMRMLPSGTGQEAPAQ